MNRSTRAVVALGSNLGDRQRHLQFACDRLRELLANVRVSSVIETRPVGVSDDQPPYLNAVVLGDTTLSALEFFDALQAIELAAGRDRPFPGAARTLDLDLILFGTKIVSGEPLTIPHPRFRERHFVLEPLAEIAPELRDPVTSLTMAELLARLPPAR